MIGTVIGSGIFLVPGGVLRQAGGQAGPALVWVVGGVVSLLGALAYGELGAMNPAAGGLYVYLRDAFGPLTAFPYGWTFYGLGTACVFVPRRTRPDADRPFRVPGYPWTPLLFIVAATALVANTIATQPRRAAVGIAVVLLGLPVYFIWRRGDAFPPSEI